MWPLWKKSDYKMKIVAAMIYQNSEDFIELALRSVMTWADKIILLLSLQVESSLRESDIGVWVTSAKFATKCKWFIEAGRGEPADTNIVVRRMVIAEKIVLASNTYCGPVTKGVLLRFMHIVFANIGVPVRMLHPVRMPVFSYLAGGFRTLIDGRRQYLEIPDPILTDCMPCQR